jgi:hypothetical protein
VGKAMSLAAAEYCIGTPATSQWTQVYGYNGQLAPPQRIVANLSVGVYRLDVWQATNAFQSKIVYINGSGLELAGWAATYNNGGAHIRVGPSGTAWSPDNFPGYGVDATAGSTIINTPGITAAILNSTYSVSPTVAVYKLNQ